MVVTKFLRAKDNKLVQSIIGIFALKPPHSKFLNIFSGSCVSGNLPIVGNQTLILNEFLKQLDEMSTFTFKYDLDYPEQPQDEPDRPMNPTIKTVYVDCFISKDHQATRRLKEFFEESGRIDLHQTSNYFISYLNLLADICYGKNTEARTHIEEKLRPLPNDRGVLGEDQPIAMEEPSILDILVAILQDNEMNSNSVEGNINLQKAVLRLITFAYIESADQNPVLRINRYRNLDQMRGEKLEKQDKFFKIMGFIKQEITSFKSFYSGDSHQGTRKEREIHALEVKNRLYTILDLFKSTLINGFWTIEEQLN